jgi:hypothetical protein
VVFTGTRERPSPRIRCNTEKAFLKLLAAAAARVPSRSESTPSVTLTTLTLSTCTSFLRIQVGADHMTVPIGSLVAFALLVLYTFLALLLGAVPGIAGAGVHVERVVARG